MFARLFECQNCGGFNGFSSRPRSFAEKYILPMLFLRPVRCGDCSAGHFRTGLSVQSAACKSATSQPGRLNRDELQLPDG